MTKAPDYKDETQPYGSVQAMTEQSTGTKREIGRRRVLRAAGAGVAGAVGVAAGADDAAATYCPRPPAHWADREWPDTDRVDDPLTLAVPADERSIAAWKLLLATEPADTGESMAREVLAARLNFQRLPSDENDCVDQSLEAMDGRTIRDVKVEAKEWLVASDWPDGQATWLADGVDGEPLHDALAAFNRYGLATLSCHCAGVDAEGRYDTLAGDGAVEGTDTASAVGRVDGDGGAGSRRLRGLRRRFRLLGGPDAAERTGPSP